MWLLGLGFLICWFVGCGSMWKQHPIISADAMQRRCKIRRRRRLSESPHTARGSLWQPRYGGLRRASRHTLYDRS